MRQRRGVIAEDEERRVACASITSYKVSSTGLDIDERDVDGAQVCGGNASSQRSAVERDIEGDGAADE